MRFTLFPILLALAPSLCKCQHSTEKQLSSTQAFYTDKIVPDTTWKSSRRTLRHNKVLKPNAPQRTLSFCDENSGKRKFWIAAFLPFPAAWKLNKIDASESLLPVEDAETAQESMWRGIRSARALVNSRRPPVHQICIEATDTPCDTAQAIRSLFTQMERRPDTLAVIGPSCYHVISTLAPTIQWWNAVEIVFNVNEGELANRRLFPTLVRTMPSLRAQLVALTTFLAHYNWSVIDVVHNDDARCYEKYNQLIDVIGQGGIHVGTVCVVKDKDAKNSATECGDVVRSTRNNIKLFLGEGKGAREFFCEIYKTGVQVRKQKTVWIVVGNFDKHWWSGDDVNCTSHEMTRAISGHFLIDDRTSANSRLNWRSSVTSWAYDAIVAASKALDITLTETSKNISLGNETITPSFRRTFLAAFESVNAAGRSGQLQFIGGERQATLYIRQFRDADYVTVGRYVMMAQALDVNESNIQWPGSGEGPPLGSAQTAFEIDYLSPYIVGLIAVFSGVGIVLAFVFLSFNIRHRAVRIIKMSSPNLNNVIVVGCVTAYVSLILSCIQTNFVTSSLFDVLCKIRNWMPVCAFTLAFGTMFLKTWRVHAIFTNVTVKKKVISDYQLFAILAVFLSVDVIVLTTWHVIDPMKRVVKNTTDEVWVDGGRSLVVFQTEFCQSNYALLWLAIICTYKGILLVFGLFLAWETRHVALTTLNDSKYIGASVYVTVVACVIGPTTSFALRDYLNLSFAISTLSILLCTTATLCLVFVPKVTALRRMRDNPDQLMHVRLQGIKRSNATERPVRAMLSMTIKNTPGMTRMMSGTANTSLDEKQSSSSHSNESSSAQDVKSLRVRLRAERKRLEKILEDKGAEINSAISLATSTEKCEEASSTKAQTNSAL